MIRLYGMMIMNFGTIKKLTAIPGTGGVNVECFLETLKHQIWQTVVDQLLGKP